MATVPPTFHTLPPFHGGGLGVKEDELFKGQKLHHPFATEEKVTKVVIRPKDSRRKSYEKEMVELKYTPEFADERCRRAVEEGRCFMKHDGSCGLLTFDKSGKPVFWTRLDLKRKRDKRSGELADDFPEPEEGWIACEPKPTSEGATHWPHMVPIAQSDAGIYQDADRHGEPVPKEDRAYQFQIEAARRAVASGKIPSPADLPSGCCTLEWMGRKFNHKEADSFPEDVGGVAVLHNLVEFDLPRGERSYEGLRAFFERTRCIEGLVFYHPELGGVFKVRASMFPDLDWPPSQATDLGKCPDRNLSRNVALI